MVFLPKISIFGGENVGGGMLDELGGRPRNYDAHGGLEAGSAGGMPAVVRYEIVRASEIAERNHQVSLYDSAREEQWLDGQEACGRDNGEEKKIKEVLGARIEEALSLIIAACGVACLDRVTARPIWQARRRHVW